MKHTPRKSARNIGKAQLKSILRFNAELDHRASDRLMNETVIVNLLGNAVQHLALDPTAPSEFLDPAAFRLCPGAADSMPAAQTPPQAAGRVRFY